MTQTMEQEKLLTVHEVATILRVESTTVRNWIKNGVLEGIALPVVNTRTRGYRIPASALDALLAPKRKG